MRNVSCTMVLLLFCAACDEPRQRPGPRIMAKSAPVSDAAVTSSDFDADDVLRTAVWLDGFRDRYNDAQQTKINQILAQDLEDELTKACAGHRGTIVRWKFTVKAVSKESVEIFLPRTRIKNSERDFNWFPVCFVPDEPPKDLSERSAELQPYVNRILVDRSISRDCARTLRAGDPITITGTLAELQYFTIDGGAKGLPDGSWFNFKLMTCRAVLAHATLAVEKSGTQEEQSRKRN